MLEGGFLQASSPPAAAGLAPPRARESLPPPPEEPEEAPVEIAVGDTMVVRRFNGLFCDVVIQSLETEGEGTVPAAFHDKGSLSSSRLTPYLTF